MSRVNVLNMSGEKLKQMNISNDIFGIEPHKGVMHAAVVYYLAP